MARKPATEEERRNTKKRIRQAAAEVFREKGISGVTARAIAAKADVSVGKIYSYFGSLTDLMQSLWMIPVRDALSRLETVAAENPDPKERLDALIDAYIDFADSNPELYRSALLFVRPADFDPPEAQPLEAAPFSSLLIETIVAGQKEKKIRAGDPAVLAQMIWAGIHGCFAAKVNFDRIEFQDSADLAGEMKKILTNQLFI